MVTLFLARRFLSPWWWGDTFHRNVGSYKSHTAYHPRRRHPSFIFWVSISQKTTFFIVTAMKTTNLTLHGLSPLCVHLQSQRKDHIYWRPTRPHLKRRLHHEISEYRDTRLRASHDTNDRITRLRGGGGNALNCSDLSSPSKRHR
jgi:hypothetical protein